MEILCSEWGAVHERSLPGRGEENYLHFFEVGFLSRPWRGYNYYHI